MKLFPFFAASFLLASCPMPEQTGADVFYDDITEEFDKAMPVEPLDEYFNLPTKEYIDVPSADQFNKPISEFVFLKAT